MATSIPRSLAVLERVALARGPLSHSELARAMDLPKSTLSGILKDLRELGYITQVDDGRHIAGPALYGFVARALGVLNTHGAIRPVLEAIASTTRETALFAIRAGNAVVYVDKVDSSELIRYVPEIGKERPLHATAVGKAILAWSPPSEVEQLILTPFTGGTITDRQALIADLATSRERGYAVNDEESQAGLSGVAVPVHVGGELLGAISVAGPSERLVAHSKIANAIWEALRASRFDHRPTAS